MFRRLLLKVKQQVSFLVNPNYAKEWWRVRAAKGARLESV